MTIQSSPNKKLRLREILKNIELMFPFFQVIKKFQFLITLSILLPLSFSLMFDRTSDFLKIKENADLTPYVKKDHRKSGVDYHVSLRVTKKFPICLRRRRVLQFLIFFSIFQEPLEKSETSHLRVKHFQNFLKFSKNIPKRLDMICSCCRGVNKFLIC